tara:strand:- start:4352 stop:7162 length:2811 start_codon:yes stop_codon:yes gene_type:complete
MIKRTGTGWAFLAGFIALCVYTLHTDEGFFKNINQGIDLQGGTELQYKLDLSSIKGAANSDVTEQIKDIISNRLDIYGLKEIRIAIEGSDRLVVTIPGSDSASTEFIQEQIQKAGKMSLQLVVNAEEHTAKIPEYRDAYVKWETDFKAHVKVHDAWEAGGRIGEEPSEPSPPEYVVWPEMEKDKETGKWEPKGQLVLSNIPRDVVDGDQIKGAAVSINPQDSSDMVTFAMDDGDEGAIKLGQLTNDNKGERLAIVMDGQVISAPSIRGQITTNGQITGDFTREEVVSIVTILNGGSLPTKPQLISKNTVGSLLGKESVESSKLAILIGLVLVMTSIALYYLMAGLVANFALAFNMLAVLAYVACFRQTLTLPGVAGILLTIGMAIDANILIFERVREERIRGKTLLQSLTTGYQRAFSVIFDSNLTTVITGLVLFNFGTGPVKGFAITLIAGIIISFISSLFVTRLIISTLLNAGIIKKLNMVSAFSTPKFVFSKIQKPFLVISVLVIIGSWAVVIPRGMDNYGIDFNGGARVGFSLKDATPREKMDSLVEELQESDPTFFKEARLQPLGDTQRRYIVMTRIEQEEKQEEDATASVNEDKAAEAADRVRDKLSAKLAGMLVPVPFKMAWADDSDAASGKKVLSVNVNLEPPDDTGVKKEDLQKELNLALSDDAENFKGLKVEECNPAAVASPGASTISFDLKFAAFVPRENGQPSREQAEAAVRGAFKKKGVADLCILSEPFFTTATVGATVSADLQQKAIIAFFISILSIIFYVSLRFEFYFGLAAIAALLHDVLISIGIIALIDQFFPDYSIKINLPEIAALLTIIGYSINDTIVVFDRIRENLKIFGKNKLSFRECVDLSINQTLSRTLLTSVTTLMTVGSLLFLGGEAIRGFAFTFMIGLIAGTYSSVFIASPILIMLRQRALLRKEELAKA